MLRGLFERECGEDDGFADVVRSVRWSSLSIDTKRSINAAVNVSISSLDLDTCSGRHLLVGGEDSEAAIPNNSRNGAVGVFTTIVPSGRASGEPTIWRSGHAVGETVRAVRWLPHDAGLFVTGDECSSVGVWDTEVFEKVLDISYRDRGILIREGERDMPVSALDMSYAPGAKVELVAIGAVNCPEVCLLDLESGVVTHRIRGHHGSVLDVKWSPSNPFLLASCGTDGTARLYDIRRAGVTACLAVFDQYNMLPKGAAMKARQRGKKRKLHSQDSANEMGKINRKNEHQFLGLHVAWEEAADSSSSARSRRRKRLASAANTKGTHSHMGSVHRIRFTPDGCSLVTAGSDGYFRLWDSLSAHCIRNSYRRAGDSAAASDASHGVMFECSGDSSCILSNNKSFLHIHDLHSGELLVRRQGHFKEMSAMIVHPFYEELYTACGAEILCWAPEETSKISGT